MWDWQFAFSILPQILAALKITISATFAGFLLALILGMLFMFLSRSRVQPVSVVVKWLVQFIRNTPLLVQLYFVFYVFPELGVSLSPFTAGVIG
ncbi:MAG TPA: ectoine/hydroxyectoine ABC transporter permease subunit EhuD, partial [Ruminococcaceae bacterium]|nr:ectoine/hydroxyectoine ABC transporter permease subunit EhuD [Oscillospiraceae bacterium]